MSHSQTSTTSASYLNPVHNRSCPDPFILKFAGEYWAYCTGFWHDGRAFGVLHSRDLVHWRELAGALEPLPVGATCYWAPEVVCHNGRFLMYYSVGNEERMEIRVAESAHPAGPFADAGRRLTTEEFAIDAHVFVDTDGTRWLFYATDFLEHTHIGTGTVRDRMIDPWTLEGRPVPVTRARYDWQVYDPARREKGGVRWHTVEGPFVLRHKGLYYQMFSGGNWQNVTYGVSYATSRSIDRPDEWEQSSDGERVLPILRTLPGKVIGPGHNSVVRGTDNRELFCVYHCWSERAEDGESARVLAIDRMDWVGERMTVLGPSVVPQPLPTPPSFQDLFVRAPEASGASLGDLWECSGGRWAVRGSDDGGVAGGEAVQESASETEARAVCRFDFTDALLEVSLRSWPASDEDAATRGTASYGIMLQTGDGDESWRLTIRPGANEATVQWRTDGQTSAQTLRLPADFEARHLHLVRLEIDGRAASLALDDGGVLWRGRLSGEPCRAALWTGGGSRAAFRGFTLTEGWESLFVDTAREPEAHGWRAEREGRGRRWFVERGELVCEPEGEGQEEVVTRAAPYEAFELVVNARLDDESAQSGVGYGFYPALDEEGSGLLIAVEQDGAGRWVLSQRDGRGEHQTFPLPDSFDPYRFQQFRFRKQHRDGPLRVQWEAEILCELASTGRRTERVGVCAKGGRVAFDMVRVTKIDSGDRP